MAKDGIVLYASKTGYSKRYAEYLAEELDYAIKPIQKANLFSVSCYPVVIFGGGLHHNRIDGIKGIVEGLKYFGEQTLIIYSVGIASVNDDLVKQIRLKNLPDFPFDMYSFQYLPGGLTRKDCMPGGAVAKEIEFYRQKQAEKKKMTRGDKIALSIAAGESPDAIRFDTEKCAPIITAARRHL